MFLHYFRSRSTQFIHLGVLGLSLTPIVAAILLAWGVQIPTSTCLFQWLFGFPSPSCGITRSLVALVRGDWQGSLTYHLFSPLLLVGCIVMALQAGVGLATGRSSRLPNFWGGQRGAIVLLVTLLAYYALRLYARYTTAELPFHLHRSALWQLIRTGAKAL